MRKIRLIVTICGGVILGAAAPGLAQPPAANGRHIAYFPDGQRIHEITWRKNERVIRRKIYHENGKLYRDIVYKDGRRIVERVFYKNGRLKSIWTAKTQTLKIYTSQGQFYRSISTQSRGLTPETLPDAMKNYRF